MSSSNLAATRDALHAVCEHVLAAALYGETGHIGLRVGSDGFATPAFGPDDRVITLEAERLTVTGRGGVRSAPLTTLQSAADFVEIEPGLPAGIYPLATPATWDEPLAVDPAAARELIDWYVKVSAALESFAPGSQQTLWPEHLDVAIRQDDCNFGGLAGDSAVTDPYVYVGPPSAPESDEFFTESFGAVRTWTQTPTAPLIAAFFTEGHKRVAAG